MLKQHFIYEAFPRKIEDMNFILTSIKRELNGLASIKTEYRFKYLLYRDDTGIYLRQFISSDSEAGISFLMNFYEKLYVWNIAFKKIKTLDWYLKASHYYSIWLESHHSFQSAKPWELWLNTFASSAGLIENVLNETALMLWIGEFVEFEFSIIPSSCDHISKEILYFIKEIGKSEEFKEELRSSFTDKLDFFLFDLKASHNLKDEAFFWDILYKNLGLYRSNWNHYEYTYSSKTYPRISNRYRKGQMDMFLSHWILTLVSETSRYTNKLPSLILPINPALALSGGTGKKQGEHKVFIGKWFRDLRLDQQEYVSYEASKCKNSHFLGIGWTWSGKSYSTSPIIGMDIVSSIVEDRIKFEKNWSPRSSHTIIDPHASLSENMFQVIEIFNKEKNYKYQSEFEIIQYHKEETNIKNTYPLPLKNVKLTFNPLYSKDLNIADGSKFLKGADKLASACLDGIRATHSKSSFWPQNSDILATVIRLFVIFNTLRSHTVTNKPGNYQRMLNLWDIHSFLEDMEIYKDIPEWSRKDFKEAMNYEDEEVVQVSKKLKQKIDYYLEQLKKNAGYLSSSVNKMAPYVMELRETFWAGTAHNSYSLDLAEFYTKKDFEKTNVHFFNLWWFSFNEKNIIAGFLLSYLYHYATTRDHADKKNLISTSVWIDEASAILNGEYILEIIASSLAEIRKYWCSLKFLLQTIDQAVFSQIYPHIWYAFIFSVDHRQAELILNDLNSGCPWKHLQPKDIINCQRWRFYAFFKFTQGWNSTVLIEGLSMNQEEITYLIS